LESVLVSTLIISFLFKLIDMCCGIVMNLKISAGAFINLVDYIGLVVVHHKCFMES
jgi:hypothetical protein